MAKPEAVPKNQVCSECGLDWARHPKNATQADCIKLLKAALQNAEWRASYRPQWVVPYMERPTTWTWGINKEVKGTYAPLAPLSAEKSVCFKAAPMIEKTVTKTWVN